MNKKSIFDVSVLANQILINDESKELDFQYEVSKRQRLNSIILRYFLFLYKLLKYNSLSSVINAKRIKILSVCSTKNQIKAIKSLETEIVDNITVFSVLSKIDNINKLNFNPLKMMILSPIYYIYLYYKYIKFYGVDKSNKIFRASGDKILISIFYYQNYMSLLQNVEVNNVVVSNDHSPEIITLIIAAECYNIKRFYIQHSVVSDSFPSLDLFNYALLDGDSSYKCYYKNNKTVKCESIITGAIRFSSKNLKINLNEEIINIAINDTISLDSLDKMFKEIKRAFGDRKIYNIRLHRQQTDQRKILRMCKLYNINITNNDESVELFLATSKFLITVSSGIVLDALRMGVLPIIYEDKDTFDFFKYKEVGVSLLLSDYVKMKKTEFSFNEVLKLLRKNATYYDLSIFIKEKEKLKINKYVYSLFENK